MDMTRILVCAGCVLLVTSCVTPRVVVPPPAEISSESHRSVKVVVTDSVNTSYSRDGRAILERLVKARLQDLGHPVAEIDPQMILEVDVRAFDPGVRILRMLVGYGAGRAGLAFIARINDPSGRLVAALEGGATYSGMTGGDIHRRGDDSIRMEMIYSAVEQLGTFIQDMGRR